ncbi:hypothetical protein [[Kitasatospora] papulosa]|uniref:hypothetical protein n=1 Tax=[Kitasatospora] papulosa TaxID=1464011 RepID=UPI0036951096
MADVAVVLLAGVLGAVVLAVVLLYKAHKKNQEIISKLSAEITAQKILALSQHGPVPLPAPEPEPARRKRHLVLFIGGGIAALLASLGDRARRVWHRHRTATVTVATAVTAVAAVGAFALTSGGTSGPGAGFPSTGRPGTDTAEGDRPPSVYEVAEEDPGTAVSPDGADPALVPQSVATTGAEATPRTRTGRPAAPSGSAPPAHGEKEETGHETTPPATPSSPAPTTPAPSPTTPAPTTPAPTPKPTEPEPTGPTTPPQPPDTCEGIEVKLPPLIDLCLGRVTSGAAADEDPGPALLRSGQHLTSPTGSVDARGSTFRHRAIKSLAHSARKGVSFDPETTRLNRYEQRLNSTEQ